MSELEIAQSVLGAIKQQGFEDCAGRVTTAELHELQAENGDLNLLRTTFETDVGLTGIANHKKASLAINKTDDQSLALAASNLKTMAEGSSADPAYAIAGHQEAETFDAGPLEPDYDAMYDRIMEIEAYAKDRYPTLNFGSAGITFVQRRSCFINSNDVCFQSRRGLYNVSLSFASKEGKEASSLMYTGYSSFDLNERIQDAVNVDLLLQQSTEQVRTQNIPGKFKGDIVITPNCLTDFIGFLTGKISDGPMIAGSSVYKGKLGEQVASDKLTLRSCPVSDEMSSGYWVTGDGYKAVNDTLLENGVLKSYLLSLYGANKTGLERAVNAGGCYVVDAGDESFDDMVAKIGEGILMTRFSGGMPNDRGDFSGIAKNSYYIKDGKVQYPIKETTVSGNMVSLLQSIRSVSKERLNFGGRILPWVSAPGIVAS